MYVTNPEILDQSSVYYCYDTQLANYLLGKGFAILSRKYEDKEVVALIFAKTDELEDAMRERR